MLLNIKILGLLCLSAMGINAQKLYSLDEVRQKSVDYSHQIKKQDFYIQAAQEEIKMAERQRYATIDGQAVYLYNDKIVTNDAPDIDALHYYNIGVPITQPIYMGGAIKNNILMAESQVIISNQQKALTSNEVIFNCDIAYWNIVAREEILASWEEYETYLKALVEQISERVALEISLNNELLRAKIQYNTVLNEMIKANKELTVAKMNLNFLIGEELSSDFNLADKSLLVVNDLPDAASSLSTALTSRPEMLIAEESVQISKYSKEIAASKYRPQAGIVATPSFNNGLLNDASGVAMMATGKVTVPIVQWGNKRSERSIQQSYIDAQQQELELTRESIELEILQTAQKLNYGMDLVELAQKTVDKAQENLDIIDVRYSEQLAPLIELTDAQSLLQQSFLQFVATKMTYFYDLSSYYKAIGTYE